MALIKCEECGQMVSDKAAACPHCGCPVKKPMLCPECGEAFSESDSYCLKCGCPLTHNTQPQAEEQVDYNWGDEEEKPNNTLKWLGLLAALVVLGGAALYVWQNGMFETSSVAVDTVAVDSTPQMLAPVIELNADAMYTIDDCPTTYEGLEIIRHYTNDGQDNGRLTSIVIKMNGDTIQSQKFNTPYSFVDRLHFLDANFDGYVDFIVGTDHGMTSSVVFLWSPTDLKFVQAIIEGEEIITGAGPFAFCFFPGAKKIYCKSYAYYESVGMQLLMSWHKNNLQAEEMLIQIFPETHIGYGDLNHFYNVLDAKTEKVLFSSNDSKQIPEQWKKMVQLLTPQEEAEYAEQHDTYYDQGEDGSTSYSDNQNSSEIAEIKAQLERERSEFTIYFKQFKSLMEQYGTSSPDPYVYENLKGSLSRMIEIAERGEKVARQMGNESEANWFRSQAKECRNGKNQLIYQH